MDPQTHDPVQQSLVQPSSKIGKLSSVILVIGAIFLVLAAVAGAYFLGTKGAKNEGATQKTEGSQQKSGDPLFSGRTKRLNQNLKIFKITESDRLNETPDDSVYYEAGKFNRGELKDYTRIVAIRPAAGPGSPLVFVLATKNFVTYILDDPDNSSTKFPEDDWQNPYSTLDKTKISSTKTFETDLPRSVGLNDSFSLFSQGFPTHSVQTNASDKYGNKIYETLLVTDFTPYEKLTSPFEGLTLYSQLRQKNSADRSGLSQDEKDKEATKEKYLLGETEVVAVDSVGFGQTYSLSTPENIKTYSGKIAQYEIAARQYLEDLKKFSQKQITKEPVSPEFVSSPNLWFRGSDIKNASSLKFFKDYKTAFPGGCSISVNSQVVRLNDNELDEIGSISGLPLYKLKDSKHPLYALAFKNKMDYYNLEPTALAQVNKDIKKPTLEEYTNDNPLLFIKDYWQRWVAFGEYDILLPGGCGKPVIYLYPTKPTEVSVKFNFPVFLTTDIPTYANLWQVKASPDGSLVNLRPFSTDCQKTNFEKRGSEYAREACQKNVYPYLFWAGNVISKTYPVINTGWVVERDRLASFLESKLDEIGFNHKEKTDFLDYWLSDMEAKNAPFYRISFLQTTDLNSLFPMTVSPNPDTIFRLFIDYLPLNEKPDQALVPPVLTKLVRNGFTLVEWGGRH